MSAISAPIQSVIDLFSDPLRDVRFADVDASTLAELATSTASAAEAVVGVEAELTRARRALQERQDALLLCAQRALSYARVYAEADPLLSERLEQIALPRVPRRPRSEGDALVLQSDPLPRARPRARAQAKEQAVEDEAPEDGKVPVEGVDAYGRTMTRSSTTGGGGATTLTAGRSRTTTRSCVSQPALASEASATIEIPTNPQP